MELPFYERYPEKYKTQEGVANFYEFAYIDEEHDKYLPEEYFPLVGQVRRFPNYKNKRTEDPFIKMFYDENNIEQPEGWGLPIPNEEAAYKSLSKYAKDMPFMEDEDIELMNEAWKMTETHFGVYMQGSEVRTYAEVKCKLDMSTSSGIPFNSLYPTKKELFENDPDIDQWLEDDWEKLADDENWTSVWTNSLKEEIRPSEKTKLNKIRTFTAGATDMTVHGNRLFADMNEKMNNSWLKSSSTVGWSPMGGNWERMIKKLSVFKNGYALDESEYDSSLRSYMMWGCARLRWNMLKEEHRTARNFRRLLTYYRNLVNAVIASPTGVLVMKLGGNPSGSTNTINDNTLILYTLLCFAWLKLNPEEFTSLYEFENNTAKCLCGDDNTWTVSDWAHEFYNAKTIIACWKKIGITTTTDSMEPREAQELDYLSAHTVYVKGIAVPQYNKEKIITSLLYSNKKKQTPAQALTRVAGMMQIGYCDSVLYKFLRGIIDWLIDHYDDVCADDPEWIVAKTCVLSDSRLLKLWTGEDLILKCQSYVEKAKKDNKGSTNSKDMNNNGNVRKPNPKRRGGKGRKGKKTQSGGGPWLTRSQLASQVGKGITVSPQFQKRRNRGNRNGNFGGKQLTGKGSTRNRAGNIGRRQQVIEEDEFIAAVTVANQPNFNATAYSANIGQPGTFPWGNSVAKNFQKYRFDYLEFYYKREVSEFATNGQVGKVMMFFNPDASDGPPTTKQQIEDSEVHADCMPCENMRLVIPKRMLNRMNDAFFIRTGGLVGGTDIKTYDIGNFYIATQGIVNNVEIGELHVRYRCRVMIPVIPGLQAAGTNLSTSLFSSAAIASGATTVATTLPLATAQTNGLQAVNTAGSIVLPSGNYIVDAMVSTSENAANIPITSNLQLQKNGVIVGVASIQASNTGGAGVNNNATLTSQNQYVTVNGTDTLTLILTNTFGSGAPTVNATLRIMAA